jgi:serine/threonine-protein kinase
LIDRSGHPFVSDFGLAKRVTADVSREAVDEHTLSVLTHSGAIVGTPGYMAPEQAAGNRGDVSRATDVYGLGALLYATLTGRAPFQSVSPVDTVLQVLEQDPLPPRLLNPGVDADLEMISLRCLQKPAELRYASADELADDLERFLANEPIAARSSRFDQVMTRAFRETHHAVVLENWGVLWMWHSLVLIVLCLITNAFQWQEITARLPYVGLWTIGLGVWAIIFWNLRRRSGPITFVERQIAHIWAGSVICSTLLFGIESLLDLPVLTLSPVLGLVSGMVFLVKAGILSGAFYIQAAALFATAGVMALWSQTGLPPLGISLFGLVSAACFFVPGLKYYRQQRSRLRS